MGKFLKTTPKTDITVIDLFHQGNMITVGAW